MLVTKAQMCPRDRGNSTHEFASGKDSLPSYTIEVGHPQVPAYFRHTGVVFDSIGLEFARSGAAAAAISCVAQGEERFNVSQGGTPTKLDFRRISQFRAPSAGAVRPSPTSPRARSPTPTTSGLARVWWTPDKRR